MDRRNHFCPRAFYTSCTQNGDGLSVAVQNYEFFFEENIQIDVACLFPNRINALSNVLLISIFLALPTVIHILTQHLNSLRPYLSRQSQAKHSKYRYIISDTHTLINSVDTSSGKRFRDSLLAWNYAILQIDHH